MTNGSEAASAEKPWLSVTLNDLEGLDLDCETNTQEETDYHEISTRFRELSEINDRSNDNRKKRLLSFLSAITSMYFRPEDKNDPFGPMFQSANGRSPSTIDFKVKSDVLIYIAQNIKNPVLGARLADLCWLVDRKQGKLALRAVAYYTDTVLKIMSGELKARYEGEDPSCSMLNRSLLQRALTITNSVGRTKPEAIEARALVAHLRRQAIENGKYAPAFWFSEIDIDFQVSPPEEVSRDLESIINRETSPVDYHLVVQMLNLCATGYHRAKMQDDKNRCISDASEVLVNASMQHASSAMLASEILSDAIAQLHDVPGKKDRRKELRAQLVELQERTLEEMHPISHEIDLTDEIKETELEFNEKSLFDQLFLFACIASSPDPAKLKEEALKSIREHPLSSMFAMSHLDANGKVVFRSNSSVGSQPSQGAIDHQISQGQSLWRLLVVSSRIEIARSSIADQQLVSKDYLVSIINYSPFVPKELCQTYAHGFTRFFQGDFVSAIYVLTPLLEASLRHALIRNNVDVTIFDDAKRIQKDHTISSMFEQLRDELDKIFGIPITSEIERLFLSKPGPYLRHSLSHGLMNDRDPFGANGIYACWFLFRLCLLPLMPVRDRIRSAINDPG